MHRSIVMQSSLLTDSWQTEETPGIVTFRTEFWWEPRRPEPSRRDRIDERMEDRGGLPAERTHPQGWVIQGSY
jgi:hypothetical protein